jgi:hypothetical protein
MMKKYIPTITEFINEGKMKKGHTDTTTYRTTVKQFCHDLDPGALWDEDYDSWKKLKTNPDYRSDKYDHFNPLSGDEDEATPTDTSMIIAVNDTTLEDHDIDYNPDETEELIHKNWKKTINVTRTWETSGDEGPSFILSFKLEGAEIKFVEDDSDFWQDFKDLRRKAIDKFKKYRSDEDVINWFKPDVQRFKIQNAVFDKFFKKLKKDKKLIARLYKEDFIDDIAISFNRLAPRKLRDEKKFPTKYGIGLSQYG